ncbi:MAG: hypothetical protein CME06_10775 [Gemmatimonadetes bacterium]|nr:hypothetical protein [Gemmatimonadota bacterium]
MRNRLDEARRSFESDLDSMRSATAIETRKDEDQVVLARVGSNVLDIAGTVFTKMYRTFVEGEDSAIGRRLAKPLDSALPPAKRFHRAYCDFVNEMLVRWNEKAEKDERFGRHRERRIALVQIGRMEAVQDRFEHHFGKLARDEEIGDV